MSLASEEAAQARHDASQLGYCNIKFRSVTARVQAYAGVEYIDNVTYSTTKPESDVALRAGLNIQSLWPISDLNSLYLSTGAGYIKYAQIGSADSPYITPNSGILFQMYSGDFLINLHDRFSLIQSGSQNSTVNSIFGYDRLQNTLGANVDWDLNDLILSAQYDHDLLMATQPAYKYVNRNSDLLSTRAMYDLNRRVSVGLEAAGGLTYYDQQRFPNNNYYSIGAASVVKLSQFLKVRLSAGWADYTFDSPPTNSNSNLGSDQNSYYAKASIDHQLTRFIFHSLTLQHNLGLGEWYAVGNLDTASYSVTWTADARLTVSGSFYYSTGDIYNPAKESLTWFGPRLEVQYHLGPKLFTSLTYQYSQSESATTYTQNRIGLNLTYTF